MASFPMYGEYYEEYVPAAHELAPSLSYFFIRHIGGMGKLVVDGEVYFKLCVIISITKIKD
jgi:hypothetical protein